jgi:hypothetical protein
MTLLFRKSYFYVLTKNDKATLHKQRRQQEIQEFLLT